jgi:DNA-binding transcriptional ArsR family regulator
VSTYIQNGLNALGDPTRLAIFHRLAEHPHAVNELAEGFPISRPAVSQHLRVLKQARLVRDRAEGTRRIYELNPTSIALLRDHFAKLWDKALMNFKRLAEEDHRKEIQYDSKAGSVGSGKKIDPRGSTR